jgi:hypothetical protein
MEPVTQPDFNDSVGLSTLSLLVRNAIFPMRNVAMVTMHEIPLHLGLRAWWRDSEARLNPCHRERSLVQNSSLNFS